MYLGEIYFASVFPDDIENFKKRLQDIGYYIKKSDDEDAEENQYDLFKKDDS